MIPLPLFGFNDGGTPPPSGFTVLLLNANQTAGTDLTVDDTGLRTITNAANDGTSAATPPLTGLPTWMGANALQKSADAFIPLDSNAISYTETDYSTEMDITDGVDFMLEFHVRFTANEGSPTQRVLAEIVNASNERPVSIRVTDRVVQFFINGSLVGDAGQIPIDTWAHIAVNRRGNVWNLYQDGLKTGVITYTQPPLIDNAFKVKIQSHLEDQPIFDAIRMCKGGAIYYDAFDAPTSEPTEINSDPEIGGRVVFLANAENGAPGTRPATDDIGNMLDYNATTGGFDNPNTGHTVEAGGRFSQGWFPGNPGSTEFPMYPNSSVWAEPGLYAFNNRATENMCLEAWVQMRSTSSLDYVYVAYDSFGPTSTGTDPTFGFRLNYSGGVTPFITIYKANFTSASFDVTGTNLQTWNHIAAVLEDGVGKIYLNGQFVGDWGAPFTDTTSGVCKPAIRSVELNELNMAIVDGMRLTMGTPVYTGNFPVPTMPPTTSIP